MLKVNIIYSEKMKLFKYMYKTAKLEVFSRER